MLNHLTSALRSGSMAQQEHVHIISAGENIHTAYPAIFRRLPDITGPVSLLKARSTNYQKTRRPKRTGRRPGRGLGRKGDLRSAFPPLLA